MVAPVVAALPPLCAQPATAISSITLEHQVDYASARLQGPSFAAADRQSNDTPALRAAFIATDEARSAGRLDGHGRACMDAKN